MTSILRQDSFKPGYNIRVDDVKFDGSLQKDGSYSESFVELSTVAGETKDLIGISVGKYKILNVKVSLEGKSTSNVDDVFYMQWELLVLRNNAGDQWFVNRGLAGGVNPGYFQMINSPYAQDTIDIIVKPGNEDQDASDGADFDTWSLQFVGHSGDALSVKAKVEVLEH